jgi:hypothetical protein
MSRLGYAASGVLLLGLWLPWAELSIGLFGGNPEGIGTVDGREIGSDLLDLPVGWIAAAAGLVGAYALARGIRGLALGAGTVAVLTCGYTLLAIPGTETTTSNNGQDVSDLVNGQIDYAWGVFAVSVAAVLLLVAAVRLPTQDMVGADEPIDQSPEPGT